MQIAVKEHQKARIHPLLLSTGYRLIVLNAQEKLNFLPQITFQRLQAYITKEAGLTQDEAARFFPIFKETREQERKIHQAIRKKIHASQRVGLSEKESEKLLAEIQELSLSEAKLKNANIKKWRKFLSASKVLKVLKAESDFNRQTFREFSKQ